MIKDELEVDFEGFFVVVVVCGFMVVEFYDFVCCVELFVVVFFVVGFVVLFGYVFFVFEFFVNLDGSGMMFLVLLLIEVFVVVEVFGMDIVIDLYMELVCWEFVV